MKYIIPILLLVGCTDASMSSFTAFGSKFQVQCYSGGTLIMQTISSGKVANSTQSDGYEFQDEKTGKFVRVNADCIVKEK